MWVLISGDRAAGHAFAVGLGWAAEHLQLRGIIILIERSLKVGDFVDLQSGVRGYADACYYAVRTLTRSTCWF
jgi:hypothetical protein